MNVFSSLCMLCGILNQLLLLTIYTLNHLILNMWHPDTNTTCTPHLWRQQYHGSLFLATPLWWKPVSVDNTVSTRKWQNNLPIRRWRLLYRVTTRPVGSRVASLNTEVMFFQVDKVHTVVCGRPGDNGWALSRWPGAWNGSPWHTTI